MPITYIVGTVASGRSTLLDAFKNVLPTDCVIHQPYNFSERDVERAVKTETVPHDKLSFFVEHPREQDVQVLLSCARKYPAIRFFVTLDAGDDIPGRLLRDMLRGF